MKMDDFFISELANKIGAVVPDVKQALQAERGETYDERLIEDSMWALVAKKIDAIDEGLREMFTSPGRDEFHELAAILERRSFESRAENVEQAADLAGEFGDESVFTGNRIFSKPRMAAMMEYLTAQGHFVYKTSLNKLLFYSDLTNFYLRGVGMSGAMYHNRRFGPVADPAAPILDELIRNEKVNVVPRTQSLAAATTDDTAILSADDRKVLDWVAETYGPMSASEVSEFSHNEMAYKNTNPNEPIAYAYAQFLKQLPPKNLLDQ